MVPTHHTFSDEGSRLLRSTPEVTKTMPKVIKNDAAMIPVQSHGFLIRDRKNSPVVLAAGAGAVAAGAVAAGAVAGAAAGAVAGAVVGGFTTIRGAAADIFYSSNRMKRYHIYFLFLKFLLVAQTILILFQVENPNKISYIATDILFKVSLGLFLIVFFNFSELPGMDFYDKLIASFAGVLLTFDAVYVSLPILLVKLGYTLPSWIVVQSIHSPK